ncbi:hypothetical protein QE152_g23713 [Popillia japonica]|uniref:Uncharacterized protein n=1 Tax=Popillia japonica TaxID=7064 RepID=A0AAW1KDT7_POPJA
MTNTHPYTRSSISQAEISTIPTFSGDGNVLPLFVDACTDLVTTYADRTNPNNPINAYLVKIIKSRLGGADLVTTYADRTNPNNPINAYLVKIIKSRLGGEAQALIGSRKLKTWTDIKQLLQTTYLDQRSEDCLLNDLMSKQPKKGENPYTFGQRIKDILNLLLTKMQMDTGEELIPNKNTLYKNAALQTYKRGLMRHGKKN